MVYHPYLDPGLTFEHVIIRGVRFHYHDELRILFVKQPDGLLQLAQLSPTEYQIVTTLRSGQVIADEELLKGILHAAPLPRDRLLQKHVDNLRSKLRALGLRIFRVTGYGYVLLPSEITHQERWGQSVMEKQ